MVKIFVPANNKGGVGKTKVSSLYSEYCAKIKKLRVLGIDFDPQCNFSQLYLDMEVDPSSPEGYMPPIHPDYIIGEDDYNGRSSIADIFYKEVKTQGVLPYPTYIENFDIAPAHASRLLEAELVRKAEIVEKIHLRMKEFLSDPALAENYDIVVIDTAPSKGPLTISAIHAATDMIIPCVMEDKPIQGIYGMVQLWMQEKFSRSSDNPLNLIGILPNMYDARTALHSTLFEDLKDDDSIGKLMMDTKLSRRIAFAEVDSNQTNPRSIFDFPDSDKSKQEAIAACELIYTRMFNHG